MVGITPSQASDDDIKQDIRDGMKMRDVLKKHKIGSGRAYKLKREVQRKGVSAEHNMHHPTLDHLSVTKTSTLVDKRDGSEMLQWVIASEDREKLNEIIEASLRGALDDVTPRKPVVQPAATVDELCNLYTISDAHIGMLASHRENGESNWDLSIAEQTIIDAFAQMIQNSPRASRCIINQLGDWTQTDSIVPETPTSGNVVDVDGRFGRIVEAAIRIQRNVADMALQKHDEVDLIIAEGNHDIASSIWLRRLFSALYEREDRLSVVDSDMPYYAVQHGRCMIGAHHGHLKKPAELPLFFAAQFSELWGQCEHRSIHTGHRHNYQVAEHPGCMLVQHPTLAARDSHASRHAYMAKRRAISHTYHKDEGEKGTCFVNPSVYT